ncbi:hypothetical protein F0P96_06865 [Hymenobacter busanensis]|uniref:Uncharacterized protein n=1 Tax=Hymenobacter busanensis TaxID=2607656 RepID=A0A7L4ZZS5_9BACT|nr:hypothetical protein [Hymenobacter busanensis]KAA9338548.1 hypothetical protein F0P96_06865 [Hymenobacter busanensis]QHJ09024.1 hypothetical protein GUY19_17735 [Hymenobacter busanensis]
MKQQQVRLKSFLGRTVAKSDVERRENYWRLIGKRGRIIDAREHYGGRVLVLFEDNLDDYGLENHNPVKNSLWILLTDLVFER